MPISELCLGKREVSTGSQRRSLRTNKSWWWAIPCRGATFINEGLMLAAVSEKSTLTMCSRRQVDFVFWIALTESCKGDYSFFVISWYSSCKASITTIRTMIKFSERRRRQSGKVSAIAFVFLLWLYGILRKFHIVEGSPRTRHTWTKTTLLMKTILASTLALLLPQVSGVITNMKCFISCKILEVSTKKVKSKQHNQELGDRGLNINWLFSL